jgi:anaerobic selenocysteine-containing dehydrogenase
MAVAPNSTLVHQGFARTDLFVAVHEQVMTETARMADIVLPATMFVEHDDVYKAGGHGHLQLGRKLVEPPGECRSNHEVICALAHRLGARHRGFGMTALDMVDETLRASGWPGVVELGERRWIDAQGDFAASHFVHGFGHAGGKFHFRADWAALGPHHAGMPALPDFWATIDVADAARPFRLVTAPARQFLNSSFTETPTARKRERRPTALLHPQDAARLGAVDGGRVRLGNARAEVVVDVRLFDGLQPGVVVVEGIWPNADFPGGLGINALVSDEPAAPAGGAVFHDTAVWVRAEAMALAEAAE